MARDGSGYVDVTFLVIDVQAANHLISDLGILLGLLDYCFPPRYCHLLAAHPRQEHQLHPPY